MQDISSTYPAAFLRSMEQLLDKAEYEAFLTSLGESPTAALRLNPLRKSDGLTLDSVLWEPLGRYVPLGYKAGRDLAHFSGAYYMQDASAMAAAAVLNAQPEEKVLDLCAAPGGKAGQLAAQLQGRGLLIANEPDAKRAAALSGNLERLGVCNAIVTCALPHQLAKHFTEYFDAMLVDAPCSGEGMFRRDAAARAEWREQSPLGCASRQAAILEEAAKMVKPGGRLVYSTCTFNTLENEGTIERFLSVHEEFHSEDFFLSGVGASQGGMIRLWPHKVRGEGHFVALLRKTGDRGDFVYPEKGTESKDARRAFERLCEDVPGGWSEHIRDMDLMLMGDRLVGVPVGCPSMDGMRVYRHGLHLCRVGKGYVEPDHALAMALAPEEVWRVAELEEVAANEFVRGQAMPFDGENGWTLVCYRGMPIGWGKTTGDMMKNHVPKGIRLLTSQ